MNTYILDVEILSDVEIHRIKFLNINPIWIHDKRFFKFLEIKNIGIISFVFI